MSDAEIKEENKPSLAKTTESTEEKIDPEIEEMFRAGVHFGYSRTRRHPKMKPYIFGMRNNVEIFDLEKVREKLREAEKFLEELGKEGGALLLVGAKPSAAPLVEKAGREFDLPYSARRWPGGFLTNFSVMRKRLDYLEDLKAKKVSGELAKYTKKEQLDFDEEIRRLEQKFEGLVSLKKVPEALLLVDSCEEKTASREARRLGLKTAGIINMDCDPETLTYPVPANDSAPSSIKYLLERLVQSYKKGKDLASAAQLQTEEVKEKNV